ncbi:ATP-binding protein [Lysobacter firmicutimachus]|uniref:histidine kinase n=1 Tax=Lysobacter firmicutimachus TaxID=1792846 RepID=A0ABU8D0A3_9GAMM
MNTALRRGWRLLPRTIAARLYLVLFAGLLTAHALSFALLFYERYQAATSMLMSNLEQDVTVAVAILDRIPAQERADWLPRLKRRTFHYLLGPGQDGAALASDEAREFVARVGAALGPRYPVRANAVSAGPERFQIHLRLSDGEPVTVEVQPSAMPIARWLPYVLAAQLALLLVCTWGAVRLATRPLAQLARAAESLSPGGLGPRLQETGPVEVVGAAAAFNAMQDRIAQYTQERLQILASISHDLQTPITRMKLRCEAMEEGGQRDKTLDDLGEMERLVREGIAYARSAHGAAETPLRIDLDAFLQSLVYDYQDTGRAVSLGGRSGRLLVTRPNALRRILANLIDNALAYAGSAELELARDGDAVLLRVADRGPGIPEDRLEQVTQPFYRLEGSRNRDSGGTGLGLAIAQQLAPSAGARLRLRNRDGGGLEALVRLDDVAAV